MSRCCRMEHCSQRHKWAVLGKRSGKEKEGDLGTFLFSLHFSIASTSFFFFFFLSIKPKERSRIAMKYKQVVSTSVLRERSTVRERKARRSGLQAPCFCSLPRALHPLVSSIPVPLPLGALTLTAASHGYQTKDLHHWP